MLTKPTLHALEYIHKRYTLVHNLAPCEISYFRREVGENCALLSCYAPTIRCAITQKSAVLNLCANFNTTHSAFCLHSACYMYCVVLYNTWGVQVVRYPIFFLGNGSKQKRESCWRRRGCSLGWARPSGNTVLPVECL